MITKHEAAWARRWYFSEVEGDPAAQMALRFAIYHLNSAANPADERVPIGARALTEATLETGDPMTLVLRGEPHELRRDQALRIFDEGAPAG